MYTLNCNLVPKAQVIFEKEKTILCKDFNKIKLFQFLLQKQTKKRQLTCNDAKKKRENNFFLNKVYMEKVS